MTPLSKYLAMALFIILPFIGGYVGYTFAPEKVVEVEKVVTKEVMVEKEVESTSRENKSDYGVTTKTYRDNELGIAFDYPASWGEITTENERGKCSASYSADDCNFRNLLFEEMYSAAIFLSAETKGHHDNPVGRGAFWGDYAGNITSNYLTECRQNQNCSVVENSNGVSLAMYDADPPPEEIGYQPERYYIYNPNSQYYGLVLSSHRLDGFSPENNRLFKEVIVESLRFLE